MSKKKILRPWVQKTLSLIEIMLGISLVSISDFEFPGGLIVIIAMAAAFILNGKFLEEHQQTEGEI